MPETSSRLGVEVRRHGVRQGRDEIADRRSKQKQTADRDHRHQGEQQSEFDKRLRGLTTGLNRLHISIR